MLKRLNKEEYKTMLLNITVRDNTGKEGASVLLFPYSQSWLGSPHMIRCARQLGLKACRTCLARHI
jgi:hypothetical protein